MSNLPIWADNGEPVSSNTKFATGVPYLATLSSGTVSTGIVASTPSNLNKPSSSLQNSYLRNLSGIINERIQYGCLAYSSSKSYSSGSLVRTGDNGEGFYICTQATNPGESPTSASQKWSQIGGASSLTNFGLPRQDPNSSDISSQHCISYIGAVIAASKYTSTANYGLVCTTGALKNCMSLKEATDFIDSYAKININRAGLLYIKDLQGFSGLITVTSTEVDITNLIKKIAPPIHIIFALDSAVMTASKKLKLDINSGSFYMEGKILQKIGFAMKKVPINFLHLYYLQGGYIFVDLIETPLYMLDLNG